jgi:hypothetical protein
MTTSNDCKVQHYVPQFVLRNFAASGKKKHIYVFDKLHEKTFKTAIKNIGAENAFYDYNDNGSKSSIDPKLESLETITSPIIRRIVENESLGSLKAKDKSIISLFCAVQMLRVKSTRESLKELNDTLKDHIETGGYDINKVEGFKFMNEEEIKISSIHSVLTAGKLAPYFYSKVWLLLKAPKKSPFCISDNPISLYNSVKRPGRGTLGLKVKGIEVQFPLSKNLCLSMVCPSLIEQIDQGVKKAERLERAIGITKTGFLNEAKSILDSVFTGDARVLKPENIEHLNSLQVGMASRFIYSSTDDFSLVQDMLKDEPSLKYPRRFAGNTPRTRKNETDDK